MQGSYPTAGRARDLGPCAAPNHWGEASGAYPVCQRVVRDVTDHQMVLGLRDTPPGKPACPVRGRGSA